MVELQPIVVFHSRHFVRHLEICLRICVNLQKLLSGVSTHNSVKKRSLHINKWLSYGQIQCFTAAILSAILEFVIRFVFLQFMSGVVQSNLKEKRHLYLKPFS